jgi:hypothetical protein
LQAALILMPTASYFGSRRGPAGIPSGWVTAFPLLAIIIYRRTFRRIKMPWRGYLWDSRPALNGCLVMIAVVEILKRIFAPNFPLPVRFACEVLAEGSTYILTLTVFHRDRLSATQFAADVRCIPSHLRIEEFSPGAGALPPRRMSVLGYHRPA